jgi:hypothetical protein
MGIYRNTVKSFKALIQRIEMVTGVAGVESLSLDFAYILRKFPSDPRFFSPENEEISKPPPCGFLIDIYRFYENWSTETFRRRNLKKWAACYTKE